MVVSVLPQVGEVLVESKSFGMTEDAILDGFLSRVSLNSRLAKGVHIRLGNKFAGKWEKQMREGLLHLPWKLFYTQQSAMPVVRSKSWQSRIFSHKHIVELVQEGFKDFQGKSPYENFARVDINQAALSTSPCLLAHVSKNELELFVDAIGGPLNNTSGFESWEKESRLHIDSIVANGCVLRSLLPVIKDLSSPFTLWDPFCGNGILQLMTTSILAGLPAGSPMNEYLFKGFPIHDSEVFNGISESLRLTPHAKLSLSILGTDASIEAIGIATRNFATFRSQLPTVSEVSTIPFNVSFERRIDAYTPPEGKVFIMTALPVKGDTRRKYMHFHKMVDDLVKENRLEGCIVLTSKWNQFRKLSTRQWMTELRLFSGNREVELLRMID